MDYGVMSLRMMIVSRFGHLFGRVSVNDRLYHVDNALKSSFDAFKEDPNVSCWTVLNNRPPTYYPRTKVEPFCYVGGTLFLETLKRVFEPVIFKYYTNSRKSYLLKIEKETDRDWETCGWTVI
jgi:hypothetical protein